MKRGQGGGGWAGETSQMTAHMGDDHSRKRGWLVPTEVPVSRQEAEWLELGEEQEVGHRVACGSGR